MLLRVIPSLHVLEDLGHANTACLLRILLGLLSVVSVRLSIRVGIGHDEVLLRVKAGLIDVVDVRDRLRDHF